MKILTAKATLLAYRFFLTVIGVVVIIRSAPRIGDNNLHTFLNGSKIAVGIFLIYFALSELRKDMAS